MDGWIIFQLLVDVALFAIVILLVIREGRVKVTEREQVEAEPAIAPQDMEHLESLMDELAKLVMRAERVASRIDKSLSAKKSVHDSVGRVPGPETEKSPSPRPARATEMSQTDRDVYSRAAALIKKGLPDEEVGRRVGLPPHEVGLIRRMAD